LRFASRNVTGAGSSPWQRIIYTRFDWTAFDGRRGLELRVQAERIVAPVSRGNALHSSFYRYTCCLRRHRLSLPKPTHLRVYRLHGRVSRISLA